LLVNVLIYQQIGSIMRRVYLLQIVLLFDSINLLSLLTLEWIQMSRMLKNVSEFDQVY